MIRITVGLIVLVITSPSLWAKDLLDPSTPIEEAIDHYIDARIQAKKITTAEQLNDFTLIRRTTLDLVGRIPTLQESKSYSISESKAKRAELVERLLKSPEYIPHQANEFNRMLYGSTQSDLRNYFKRVFETERSWDDVFKELIRGKSEDDKTPDEERFLKDRLRDQDRLTNDVSVAFFGINISCAQCHDHPTVPVWKQDHYFGMKSFLSRTFDNGGYLAERSHGSIKFKTTEGQEKQAKLLFLTNVEVPKPKEPDGKQRAEEKKLFEKSKKEKKAPPPPQVSLREKLIEQGLDESKGAYLSKSLVNRVWHRLIGRGLVEPLDQLHEANIPSHPELLDWLARDFRNNGYNLKRLIKGIVLSKTYSRSSEWNHKTEKPDADNFAVGSTRPLSREQYAYSLKVASTNPKFFAEDIPADQRQNKLLQLQNTSKQLASSFTAPGDNFQVNVDEALYLSNNNKAHIELIASHNKERLSTHLKDLDSPDKLVETAVWTILNRPPTQEEKSILVSFLADCSETKEKGSPPCEQLIWALLTSSEFRFNY